MKDMYGFLLNMWIMEKVDEDYLTAMVKKGFLTDEQRELIIATPQL